MSLRESKNKIRINEKSTGATQCPHGSGHIEHHKSRIKMNFSSALFCARHFSQRKSSKMKSAGACNKLQLSQAPSHIGILFLLINILISIQAPLCLAQQLYRRQARQQQRQQQSPQVPAKPPPPLQQPLLQDNNVVAEMQVVCNSDSIVLMVNTNTPFNGMLYAKDAANLPNCLSEFHASTNMTFRLPLKSCGTLMAEVDDGVEFFNTIVVQPHMRLMTNQGKGYHIRCKYQTRERTIANTHFNVSAAFLMQNEHRSSMAPLLATASMPMCTMKIYRIDQENVAESVRVGDKLVMVIEIDKQDMYGMRITNCVVRDGLNKAEQLLINDAGCPVDETIMPRFEYEHNDTRAAVAFRAHKFPHTSSIYYQCNVRLCINGGGCDQAVCPPSTGGAAAGSAANETLATLSSSLSSSSSGGATPSVTSLPPSTFSTTSSLTSTLTTVPNASYGPGRARRKRSFIGAGGGSHKQQSEQAHGEDEQLPEPSELKLGAGSNISFDVYSGLYVSDVDMSESSSGDPNGQQVLPAPRGNTPPRAASGTSSLFDSETSNVPTASSADEQQQQQDTGPACLTMGKASLLVVAASLASVCLVLLVACQAGLLSIGDDDEPTLHELAHDLEQQQRRRRLPTRTYARQYQREARSSDDSYVKSSQQHTHGNSNSSPRLLTCNPNMIGGKGCSPFYPLA